MKKTKGFLGIILFFWLIWYPHIVIAEWYSEVFDNQLKNHPPQWNADPSVAIGTDGTIHVQYLKDQHIVMYAFKNESGWHYEDMTEIIDPDIADREPYAFPSSFSLALDSHNNVYISNADNYNLFYTTNASGVWVKETVVSCDEMCGFRPLKIVFDSHDNPHICYWSFGGVQYTYKDSTGWHTETVPGTIEKHSIALDSNDNPHIVYLSEGEGAECFFKYTYKDSTGWHNEVINEGSEIRCYRDFSIALDSNDKVHLSYAEYPSPHYDIYYITNVSGTWIEETVASPDHNPSLSLSEIVLDSNDTPHISYHVVDRREYRSSFSFSRKSSLWYAKRVASEWHSELIENTQRLELVFFLMPSFGFGKNIMLTPSIQLDLNGNPHIFFLSNFLIHFELGWRLPIIHLDITSWNHAYIHP